MFHLIKLFKNARTKNIKNYLLFIGFKLNSSIK